MDYFLFFFQIRSPARQKSPEKLKLAAMKRMRDAGWTAVIGSDQKRKKINEKIFAWVLLFSVDKQ